MNKVLVLFSGRSHVSVNVILKNKVQKLGQATALLCIVSKDLGAVGYFVSSLLLMNSLENTTFKKKMR